MTRSRSRRSVARSDREVMYGVLFVVGVLLLLAVIGFLYNMWS